MQRPLHPLRVQNFLALRGLAGPLPHLARETPVVETVRIPDNGNPRLTLRFYHGTYVILAFDAMGEPLQYADHEEIRKLIARAKASATLQMGPSPPQDR